MGRNWLWDSVFTLTACTYTLKVSSVWKVKKKKKSMILQKNYTDQIPENDAIPS